MSPYRKQGECPAYYYPDKEPKGEIRWGAVIFALLLLGVFVWSIYAGARDLYERHYWPCERFIGRTVDDVPHRCVYPPEIYRGPKR